MAVQYVSHPVYGHGVIHSGGIHTRYTTVIFGRGAKVVTLPSSELVPGTVLEPASFMGGDRIAFRDRQGTVKSADAVQVHVAWDTGKESYLVSYQEGLTLLPPLPAWTPVKRKGTIHVGKVINTPSRGDTHVGVLWNSGHSSTVKLETIAPTTPQEPQDGRRTVDDALAELDAELREWQRKEREASYKVKALTDQIKFLSTAQNYPELARSIEKW